MLPAQLDVYKVIVRPLKRLAYLSAWITYPSTFGIDAGTDATQRLMNLHERPTAIFAANDNTAIGALSGLSRMGVSVPGDISVVIYYDIPT